MSDETTAVQWPRDTCKTCGYETDAGSLDQARHVEVHERERRRLIDAEIDAMTDEQVIEALLQPNHPPETGVSQPTQLD